MFEKGDIVKIQPEWLNKGETPIKEYFVMEDWGDGRVKICLYNRHGGFASIEEVAYEMVRKVGHVDWDRRRYDEGDLLGDGSGFEVVVNDVNPYTNMYELVGVAPAEVHDRVYGMHITELDELGFRFIRSMANDDDEGQ